MSDGQITDEQIAAVVNFVEDEESEIDYIHFWDEIRTYITAKWIRRPTKEDIDREYGRALCRAVFEPREEGETILALAFIYLRAEKEESYAADCDARQMEQGNPSADYEFEHDDEADHGYADEYMNRE